MYKLSIYLCVRARVCKYLYVCVCVRVCVELVFATFLIRPPMPWGQAPRQSLPGITFPYIWRRRGNRHHLQGRLCLRPSWCSLRLPIPFSFQPSLSPLSSVFFPFSFSPSPCCFFYSALPSHGPPRLRRVTHQLSKWPRDVPSAGRSGWPFAVWIWQHLFSRMWIWQQLFEDLVLTISVVFSRIWFW